MFHQHMSVPIRIKAVTLYHEQNNSNINDEESSTKNLTNLRPSRFALRCSTIKPQGLLRLSWEIAEFTNDTRPADCWDQQCRKRHGNTFKLSSRINKRKLHLSVKRAKERNLISPRRRCIGEFENVPSFLH